MRISSSSDDTFSSHNNGMDAEVVDSRPTRCMCNLPIKKEKSLFSNECVNVLLIHMEYKFRRVALSSMSCFPFWVLKFVDKPWKSNYLHYLWNITCLNNDNDFLIYFLTAFLLILFKKSTIFQVKISFEYIYLGWFLFFNFMGSHCCPLSLSLSYVFLMIILGIFQAPLFFWSANITKIHWKW